MCDHCGCHEFPAIAELAAEHETILSLGWQLAATTRQDVADDSVRDELLRQLDIHVTKEETGLYPLLLAVGDLSVDASKALEHEHRTIREALTVGTFDRRDYFALAAHIEAEELELFPIAMFAFDDDIWEQLQVAHHDAADAVSSVGVRALPQVPSLAPRTVQ